MLGDILREKLSGLSAGIFGNLESVFIRKPAMLLSHILEGLGNIRYIHCVIFSYTYDQYKIYDKNKRELEERQSREYREALILSINDMDEEEYANLSPEEFKVFKEHVLLPRKIATQKKREALR